MDSLRLHLTLPQLRKFHAKKPFQLTHDQLLGRGSGSHEVAVQLSPAHQRRLHSNIVAGRGFRVSPEAVVEGGSTYAQRLARRTRNTFKPVKQFFDRHGDDIVAGAKRAGRYIKKNVDKDDLKRALSKVADKHGASDLARTALDKAADIGYSNSRDEAKQHARELAQAAEPEFRKAVQKTKLGDYYDIATNQGEGLRKGRPKKGSPEAKAWGAKMRELRQQKISGGSTYSQRLARRTRNTFKPVAKALGSVIEPLKEGLSAVGDKFSIKGVNPFNAGYKFGKEVLGPAIAGRGRIPVTGGKFVRGVPVPLLTPSAKGRIATHGLMDIQRGTRNGLAHGGSFLPLG